MEMLAMEELLWELNGEDTNEQGLPPGFRFHPTDEELITFYLASKVFNGSFCGVAIAEVDLNRCEPWELPEVARMGEREWYFFSLRDRKYPTGLRTNRATGCGYWKATGKDREVYSASNGALLGMKKTLVFYKGRAPRGEKTKWVMHEYRLDGDFSYRHTCKEEWVICRICHKIGEKKNPIFQGHSYLMDASSSPTPTPSSNMGPMVMTQTAAMLESQSQNTIQSPFEIQHQESELKAPAPHPVVNPVASQGSTNQLFPVNAVHSSFSPTTTTIAQRKNKDTNTNNPSPSPSILFKPLLSHHHCTTIPKQCKTDVDSNFTQFQLSDANPFKTHHPLFFGMDCSFMGLSPEAVAVRDAASTVPEMPTSFDFNGASFQMLLDPPTVISADSWRLDL